MARFEIVFAKTVRKDFRSIPKKDVARILKLIDLLAENPRPPGCKKLSGEEIYRLRQGNYRILYQIEDNILEVFIIRVANRKEVYR